MAVILGLMAALGIGSSDLFGRRLVNASSAVTAATAMQVFAGLATVVFAVTTTSPFHPPAFVWGCLSGLGIGSGLSLYYVGLQRSSSTLMAPLVASLAAMVPYAYAVAGGSGATTLAMVGAAVAVGGLVLVTGGAVSRERLAAGLRFGIAAGLVYAAATIAFIEAATAGSEGWWPIAGQRASGALFLLAIAVVFGQRLWPPPGQTFNGVASGLITAAVSVVLLIALSLDPGPATVAMSTFPVFSVIIGRAFFADPLQRKQVVGIGLVVAGIAAVSVG